MVATNDDLLAALNKIVDLLTPKQILGDGKITVLHDGVEVKLDEAKGIYTPVSDLNANE